MRKEDVEIGMFVTFGRAKGEKTLGKVVKINSKNLKVETLERRGTRSASGTVWTVHPSMCSPANLSIEEKAELVATRADQTNELSYRLAHIPTADLLAEVARRAT